MSPGFPNWTSQSESAPGCAQLQFVGWREFPCGINALRLYRRQHDPVFLIIVLVHQLPDHPGPIHPGAPVRDFHPPPPFQGREQHEQVAHAIALVFIIVDTRGSRPDRTPLPCLLHLLFAGLVQADQNFVVPVLVMVDFQHVFHRAHELPTPYRRDAPALLQPGLELGFLSV